MAALASLAQLQCASRPLVDVAELSRIANARTEDKEENSRQLPIKF
jgi:hypothetical protein